VVLPLHRRTNDLSSTAKALAICLSVPTCSLLQTYAQVLAADPEDYNDCCRKQVFFYGVGCSGIPYSAAVVLNPTPGRHYHVQLLFS